MSTTIMIKKRDGREVEFDADKIVRAIYGAFTDIGRPIDSYATRRANAIAAYVRERAEESDAPLGVEEIQDLVEKGLMGGGTKDVARQYISYRNARTMARETPIDSAIMELLDGESEYWNRENSNKNAKWVTTQRDYMAGIVSKHIARKYIFPEDAIAAHEQGIIHIHDMDYVAQSTLHNCELINLNDMLQNGTVVNGVRIDRPHRILTATTIATQIIAAVASSSYGGATITLTHLAPFVRESHDRYLKKYKSWGIDDEKAEEFAQRDLKREVRDAVQTLTYQLNSLTTTNGQSPFISVTMYMNETDEYKPELAMLIEEVLRQRIDGLKNRKGVPVTPAFPKLLYVLEEDNVREGTPYWYLTELAAKCTAKRMVPDYISEKKMTEYRGGCWGCMGCRSFLTPDTFSEKYGNLANAGDYKEGQKKYYGRFNIGVTTINLPDVALTVRKELLDSGKELTPENYEARFWDILDERLELCHEVQRIRARRLSQTKAEVAPILWVDGALARLDPEDTLDKLVHHGYATSSIGYVGLYECVKVVTGESQSQPNGNEFGKRVMQHLNDMCNKWKADEDIAYSVYGTPMWIQWGLAA